MIAHLAPVVLSIEGVTKRFGAFVANDSVSLELRRGEMLALLGENGAGKTTLMNVLFGHYVAEAGTVRVADAAGVLRPLPPGSPAAALAAGIGMVQQHFALAGSLSVLENVVLGTRPLLSPRLDLRAARARLAALAERSGLHVAPDRRVSDLGVGERQRVEILKVLYRGARVLILDEPTAVLTPQEGARLFETLRRLRGDGLSVILISHKMGEAVAADRVAVLRAGRKVADQPVGQADKAALARLMVGRDVPPPIRAPARPGDPVLVLDGLTVPGAAGRSGIADVSLVVRGGEVVGIAGVSGNGQAALAAVVAGSRAPASGAVRVVGRACAATPAAMIRAGVARVPEDRHREGVVPALSVAENLVLETLDAPAVQSWGFLRRRAIRAAATRAIAEYDIRCEGPDAEIRLLSGGNMQKAILARVLGGAPRVVLASQPTRGLDVGAAADVHRRLLAARDGGAAVLVISEDLDELFALADRIAVIAGGRLSEPMPAARLTPERLGLLMAGERAA